MRGKRAKQLRKEAGYVAGGKRRHGRDRELGVIFCMGSRSIHQALKKAGNNG